MNDKIDQVVACDNEAKSQVLDIKSSVTLTSPYFDRDDSLFTDLYLKDRQFKEVGENSPFTIKLNSQGELESIQLFGVRIPKLDIKSIFIEGDILLIERNDGTAIRVLNSELSEDLINRVARELRVVVKDESLTILKSRWEMI